MRLEWNKHKGDIADFLILQVLGLGSNLDAVTAVSGVVTNRDNPADTAVLAANVHDSPNKLVKVQMGTWLSAPGAGNAVVGESYILELRVTTASYGPVTWPEEGVALINVK